MSLAIRDLTKAFPGQSGQVPVLDGVSLSLAEGEAVALTGESGSGKSTLLHIVAGLEPADAGAVLIEGQDITALPDTALAKLRREVFGIVFQQFNLIPSLTAGQNIAFQARLAGREGYLRLESLTETLGLSDSVNKYPEQLSGGQQQRVAIGRALAARPRIVLADEPTGNLDEATSDAVFNLLLDLTRQSGAGLLLVTHSEKLAARSDRRLHLSRGRIRQ